MPDIMDTDQRTASAYECTPDQRRDAVACIRRNVAPEDIAEVLEALGLSA